MGDFVCACDEGVRAARLHNVLVKIVSACAVHMAALWRPACVLVGMLVVVAECLCAVHTTWTSAYSHVSICTLTGRQAVSDCVHTGSFVAFK